jgi:hypothetical protein
MFIFPVYFTFFLVDKIYFYNLKKLVLFYFALSTFPLPPRFKRVIDEPGKTAGG